MGFIKAFSGAMQGTFADQWKDFYTPRSDVTATTAISQAVQVNTNNGVGSNTNGFNNVITNGSKIVVPEGMALITIQNGAITGLVAEPGGFEFRSDDVNSQSVFAGDGILSPTIKSSWEKFKFGGMPSTQQLAFYVNIKEIPGIKFGTPSVIHWQDSYLETLAGGTANGSYTLKITDPLLFVKQFVPVMYLQANAQAFDFADLDNEAGNTLHGEFVNCLKTAISHLSLEAKNSQDPTIQYIESHQMNVAHSMNQVVEENYKWTSDRGLTIQKINLQIDYDSETASLLESIKKDDQEIRRMTKMGEQYQNNMSGMMAAASGQAMQNAASNPNGAMMGFMGMNMAQQQGANLMGAAAATEANASQTQNVDPTEKLLQMKKLLDAGAISQEEYDKVKAQVLGF